MDDDLKKILSVFMVLSGVFFIGFGSDSARVDGFWLILVGVGLSLFGIFLLPDEDKLSDKRFKVVPYFSGDKWDRGKL